MQRVSADHLASEIIAKYFCDGGFDTETREDIRNYLRNFIVDEQDKYQFIYDGDDATSEESPPLPEMPAQTEQRMQSTQSTQNKESDADDEPPSSSSDDSDDDMPPLEEVTETDIPDPVINPFDIRMVDLVTIFLMTRTLYEDFRKRAFIPYYTFHADLFPEQDR